MSFVEKIKNSKMEWRYEKNKGSLLRINIPDEESVKAFVLTFRFFIQENEKSSFRSLAKTYSLLSISDVRKKQFNMFRNIFLNPYLDSESSIMRKGKIITKRDILHTYIYGYLSHSNKKWKTVYEDWSSDEVTKAIFDFKFIGILSTVLRIIRYVKELNDKVLNELNS